MSKVVIIGSQWGDEGKGKVVDLLSEKADMVIRFQGGANAGHTVMWEDKTFILHLVPSGILHPDTKCVIGNGLVVDPEQLLKEIDDLEKMGINCRSRLFVSETANIIMPYHKLLDQAAEERLKDKKIGTTGRGIGPAYKDKVGRTGARFADIENTTAFKDRLRRFVEDKNLFLKHVLNYKGKPLDFDEIFDNLWRNFLLISPYLVDASILVNREIEEGKRVLFEGAQGTFLDIDHGTYPFVTSSNTVAAGACSGCGIGPNRIDHILGIVKAYTTRVGEGPFPTELSDDVGKFLAEEGNEFGATTGRPRRCGWLDVCLLKKAVRLNGFTHLAVTKLDVLDKLETIKVCVAYKDKQGNEFETPPAKPSLQKELTPVYEELPGWQSPTSGITDYQKLPENARLYIEWIENILKTPAAIVSAGPKREQTMVREELL